MTVNRVYVLRCECLIDLSRTTVVRQVKSTQKVKQGWVDAGYYTEHYIRVYTVTVPVTSFGLVPTHLVSRSVFLVNTSTNMYISNSIEMSMMLCSTYAINANMMTFFFYGIAITEKTWLLSRRLASTLPENESAQLWSPPANSCQFYVYCVHFCHPDAT